MILHALNGLVSRYFFRVRREEDERIGNSLCYILYHTVCVCQTGAEMNEVTV